MLDTLFCCERSWRLTSTDSVFLDTTSFTEPRSLDKLPAFLKAHSPKNTDLSKASEQKGTPHTLVISAAALRAADVVRYDTDGPLHHTCHNQD